MEGPQLATRIQSGGTFPRYPLCCRIHARNPSTQRSVDEKAVGACGDLGSGPGRGLGVDRLLAGLEAGRRGGDALGGEPAEPHPQALRHGDEERSQLVAGLVLGLHCRGRTDLKARTISMCPSAISASTGSDFPTPRRWRRGFDSSERLGRHRWVVERALVAWLNRYRRLKVRYERRVDAHQALLDFRCALICWNSTFSGFVERAKHQPLC